MGFIIGVATAGMKSAGSISGTIRKKYRSTIKHIIGGEKMSIFRKKSERDREREIREEERKYAHNRLTLELKKAQDAQLHMMREYEKKIESQVSAVRKEKDDVIKNLNAQIDTERMYYKKFRRDLENMSVIATEMSSLGVAIENLTTGVTRKFHGWKNRIDLIVYSVEKKENKYKKMIEGIKP